MNASWRKDAKKAPTLIVVRRVDNENEMEEDDEDEREVGEYVPFYEIIDEGETRSFDRSFQPRNYDCSTNEFVREIAGEGENDEIVLKSLRQVAEMLTDGHRFSTAENLYRRVLRVEERVLGAEHEDTLISVNNLGSLLQEQYKLDEAEPLFRRNLEVRERVLGVEHEDTLISVNNLGLLLLKQGKWAEAEPLFRQRTWGVPITLFDNRHTQELHPRTAELFEKVAQKVAEHGIDAWFDLETKDLLGAEAEDYQKVTDTMDVWFDSGTTHFSVLEQRPELRFPADLYLEGSDQHRGWFQSSLKTSIAMHGVAPYKGVLTHGFTVDGQGRKMSKSIGNVMSPQKVCNTLGADIIRLWVASSDFSAEMAVSDEILNRTADAYRSIRNTARFLLSNLNGFAPADNLVAVDDMLALDQWVLSRAGELQVEIEAAYHSYNFHAVYQKITHFCSQDLGGFYLDIIKDRQYTCAADSLARRSAQTAMFHLIETMTRWIAPILSFTADELWDHIPGTRADSVQLDTWYAIPQAKVTNMTADYWAQIMSVKQAVNKCLETHRNQGVIGGSLSAEITLYAAPELHAQLEQLGDELRFVLLTSKASLATDQSCGEETECAGLRVDILASRHMKCERCWHHRPDVGVVAEEPELCGRCVDNVSGDGEVRHFA